MESMESQETLFERLGRLGIAWTPPVPYPAHRTVEEGKALRGRMPGTFTKNLLLRDKKGRLFMVVAHEDRVIDLKTLHQHIGANGRVGFASAEQMVELLRVSPGALTPFAIIHDRDRLVTVVLDSELLDSRQLNFHPLVQNLSMGISPAGLQTFVRSGGHTLQVVDLRYGEQTVSARQ